MIDEIKLLLGDAANNYSDALIGLAAKMASAEVEAYCDRDLDETLSLVAERIAVIKLYRMNTEGLASTAAGGVSENYVDGYPTDIQAILNRKRRIKLV